MDYKLFDLVFQSADAMMRKLYKKHLEGWRGWDDKIVSDDTLIDKLHRNLDQKDWVDVMALAAMLNYRALKSSQPSNPADGEKCPNCVNGNYYKTIDYCKCGYERRR